MKQLLSLPPNLVGCFHDITGLSPKKWFCTSDPVGHKLGSGGGTTNLLTNAFKATLKGQDDGRGISYGRSFAEWLSSEKRILLHAGGQSRRLPAYAPSGKILTPIPVFRWERGQRLSQDLLSLQIPLYEKIMNAAPESLHTMVVSGDVYIRATQPLQPIPDADVVCYGLWLDAEIAKDHGVFVSTHEKPTELECMLQKPSIERLAELQRTHFYLTDIGIWLFSDKAVRVLMERSMSKDGTITDYDMYTTFGGALGYKPTIDDPEINSLKVAILPLPGGEFYHFGTSHEIISSMLSIQNLVNDQRRIMHHSLKPQPSIFIQNSKVIKKPKAENRNIWIENSCVGPHWTYSQDNIITGVPDNDWTVRLSDGQCVDIIPIGDTGYAVRPYGYNDKFRGDIAQAKTLYIGQPFSAWASDRGIDINAIEGSKDLQSAEIFPLVENVNNIEPVLRWMLSEPGLTEGKTIWETSRKISADEISAKANLRRLTQQRRAFRKDNWQEIAHNHNHSVFYQTDLDEAAHEFASQQIPLPETLADGEPVMKRIHDAMFRSEVLRLRGEDGSKYDAKAFSLLREGLLSSSSLISHPTSNVYSDQIVWARSPVRIDIAGGWTDTPPTCLMEGGNVINLAIELNGQPPLQAYVKRCAEKKIILRSIDLGASEVITTHEELADFKHVGSPFSIPKAALVLAGFQPGYNDGHSISLLQQLDDFGSGIELTMLSAIPAGSGLGTSSILAATVLGALNDFCGLGWDKTEIGHRTLLLEQLLTTGGGWQDQFGGILQGVKLLQTQKGFNQSPTVRYLPNELWTEPEYAQCHLLYYTGITRTAKAILAEIVRRMFLNEHHEVEHLRNMKEHTMEMFDAIQQENFEKMGRLIRRTWQQNQDIDAGTNPEEVRRLTSLVDDLCLGYKLPGAGGGGYLYMVAKDPQAAARIKRILNDNKTHDNARFVDMTLSKHGLQVSRS
ncbi:MAG: bifunctional fucokinase/fucose-1-phosphate guanylyltransferase [Prevotella sp.]|nr:bifunctional fucokinase/fucose-1-phosphate guanylyltransferase [Prevotella sp.]